MRSLPNLIIFEGHTDPIAKKALMELFNPLAEMGYKSFCLESPSDLSLEQCLEGKKEVCKTVVDFLEQAKPLLLDPSIKQDATERGIPYHDSVFKNLSIESLSEKYSYIELTTLLNQYVTTKYHEKFAKLIKGYKADLCFIEMMEMIDPRMSVDFIDLPQNEYDQLAGRAALHIHNQELHQDIFKSIEARDKLFFDAISRINEQGNPVVFLCGAAHAKGLLQHIRAAGDTTSPVVFKFLHSHENIMSLAHPRPEVIMAQFLDHETGMDTTPFRHYLDDDIKLEDFVKRLLAELQGSVLASTPEINEENRLELSTVRFFAEKPRKITWKSMPLKEGASSGRKVKVLAFDNEETNVASALSEHLTGLGFSSRLMNSRNKLKHCVTVEIRQQSERPTLKT